MLAQDRAYLDKMHDEGRGQTSKVKAKALGGPRKNSRPWSVPRSRTSCRWSGSPNEIRIELDRIRVEDPGHRTSDQPGRGDRAGGQRRRRAEVCRGWCLPPFSGLGLVVLGRGVWRVPIAAAQLGAAGERRGWGIRVGGRAAPMLSGRTWKRLKGGKGGFGLAGLDGRAHRRHSHRPDSRRLDRPRPA